MTLITMQAPLPQAALRVERPTASAHALPAVAAVAPTTDTSLYSAPQERPTFRSQPDTYAGKALQDDDAAHLPQPFPDIRFADPLPKLPELDLPTKAAAYQAALSVVRHDDTITKSPSVTD